MLLLAVLAAVRIGFEGAAPAAAAEIPAEAGMQLAAVRERLEIDVSAVEDIGTPRRAYGRAALEIEGWRTREDGSRWPVDQATFDVPSGRISKYVYFGNASTRRRGEPILPMGTVSPRGDGYLALFMAGTGISLELEGMERYVVRGKDSVYYELRYSPQPRDVPFLIPLVKLLIDASTGRLYRFELAADFLDIPDGIPSTIIGGAAASTLAALHLGKPEVASLLGGPVTGEVWVSDLYYVRANGWAGSTVPPGGRARLAWVVPFALEGKEGRNILYVDALTGKVVGGLPAR